MPKGQKIEVQLPDTPEAPPSIHPAIADLRERMAATEARLETGLKESPIAGEALRLAGEAHQLAAQALERTAAATEPPPAAEPERVLAVVPPAPVAPLESPTSDELPSTTDLVPTRPWWHPSRLL
ncbi:MAG: hypothetical protein NVSMB19_15900 [Vulcanimicrobiaceae bacterium]